VRCANRVALNAASADIASEAHAVPGKQLLDEMADEMRARLRPEKMPAALQQERGESPDATAWQARVPMTTKSEFVGTRSPVDK
jgi:hypothetical protein